VRERLSEDNGFRWELSGCDLDLSAVNVLASIQGVYGRFAEALD
jgi:hypothetical protein